MNKIVYSIFFFCLINCSFAHIIHGESGWMHPLSGIDHMTAMVAVGAWSAQLGGKAIFRVPAAFVVAMLIGGVIGFAHFKLPGTELGIAISVLALGLAIALNQKASLIPAVFGVGLFGICHGYAHGFEMPDMANKYLYAIGFLVTTASLHLTGAIGGVLILDNKNGHIWLRLCGLAAVIIGCWLIFPKLSEAFI